MDALDPLDPIEVRLGRVEQRLRENEADFFRLATMLDPALALPEPIATPTAHEQSAHLNHEKFSSLLDAGEACIKYTGAIALKLAVRQGISLDLDDRFYQAPTLGVWVEMIHELAPKLDRNEGLIAARLLDSLRDEKGKLQSGARYLFDEFVGLRNKERGHTSMQPDGVVEDLYLRHQSSVHDAFSTFRHLELPLVRIEQIDLLDDDLVYDARVLVGPAPVGRVVRIVSMAKVPQGATCIWDRSGDLLDLSNLVTFQICDMCNLEHTFFLEKRRADRTYLHSYTGNHRMQPLR